MAKPRVSTILLSLGLLVSIAAAAGILMDRNKEQARRVWAEDQLEKIKIAKEALEQEKQELLRAKQTLEGQLNDSHTQAKKLSDDLAAEKRAREALAAEASQARSEIAALSEKMRQGETEKKNLTEELAKAKQSYQALSNELMTLRQAKEALERRVKEMLATQSTEAERIVVKPTQPGQPAQSKAAANPPAGGKAMEGKVLVVNREFNFIVVNLGSKDGLQSGANLTVWRGDKKIGSAQGERLYDNMAAATLMVEEQKGQIREGDQIRVGS